MPPDHPLSPGAETLAILDANVMLPPRLSDLLFDLALEGLYHPRWTATIEAEFTKHFGAVVLARDKAERRAIASAAPDPGHLAKANRRLGCFRVAVGREHAVLLYDQPAYLAKVPKAVDQGDTHVASAAIVLRELSDQEGIANAVYVVSSNLAHLAAKEMGRLGILVVSPGGFIDRLNKEAPDRVEQALLKTINDLTSPPFTKGDLLRLLMTHGAKSTAQSCSTRWGVKAPQQGPAR